MADEVLSLGVEIEIDKAVKGLASFERQMKRKMENVTKVVGKLGHTNARVLEKAIELSEDWIDDVDKLAISHSKEYQTLLDLNDAIEKQERQVGSLSGAQQEAAKKYLAGLKQQGKAQAKAMSDGLLKRGQFARVTKEVSDGIEKAIDAARPAVTSFFGKDLKGTLEGTMSFAGKALGKAVEHLRIKSAKASAGGADGGGAGAAGGAMKAVGGVFSKMGPMLSTLSKLGPLLSTVSTVVMAVVKVLIDAEAQAKAFNKEILASASTTEYLAAASGDADVGFADLESTMSAIRDTAYSLDNIEWGISADEHKAVLNVLNQEGVSIKSIENQAKVAGKTVGDFAGELTHVSVAYSRAFGVPLQEINQMQAEMMTEMGMSLQSTQLGFAQMTLAASESGIAANKFYAIIRSVSQDLSLYNIRMESAVKLLGKLGKVMNPREAQKFMQFATQGLKNMGQDDRLKLSLLAGGAGTKIVAKDLENRRNNLQKDIGDAIGSSAEDIAKRLNDPKQAKELWKEVEAKAKDKLGTLRGEALELKIDQAASKKGVYGQSFAMENMGAGGSLDMLTAALAKWGGGKTLMEGAGSIGMTKMAENMGISTDQLRGMMKLETAVQEQKETLLATAQTQTEKDRINAMGTQDILDSMSKEEQKALEDANKSELDMAKKQSGLTNDLLSKLTVLVDFIMNQIYNVMINIWEGVLSAIPEKLRSGKMDAALELIAAKKNATGRNKSEITAALDAADPANALNHSKTAHDIKDILFKTYEAKKGGLTPESYQKDIQRWKDRKDTGESMLTPGEAWSAEDDKQLAAIEAEAAQNKKLFDAENKLFTQMGQTFSTSQWSEVLKASDVDTAEFDRRAAADPSLTASGILAGMETQGLISNEKIQQAMQAFYSSKSSASLAQKTEGLSNAAGIASDAGLEAVEQTADATKDLHKDATHDNTLYFRFSTAFHKEFARTAEKGLLDSLRTALWEFYLYSEEEDRGKLIEEMGKHDFASPQAFVEALGKSGTTVGGMLGYEVATKDAAAAPNAAGGVVTGIGGDGLANVRAAAGEGLTSIGRGEVIVPRGGTLARSGDGSGTSRVEISIQRGFEQFIEAKVTEGIQDFKRRERFS